MLQRGEQSNSPSPTCDNRGMTLIAALVLVPGLLGVIYYLRRVALALEADDVADALAPEQPTVQPRGLGGGGRLAK